jgi:hypothetical protein
MKKVKLFPVRQEHTIGVPIVVNVDNDPQVSGIELDATSPVVVWVAHRERPDSCPTPSGDLPVQTRTWAAVSAAGVTFTPSKAGIYTVVLVGTTLAPGATQKTPVTFCGVPVRVS